MYKIFFLFFLISSLNAQIYDGVAIVVKDKAITLMEIEQTMQSLKVDAKAASDILIRQALEGIEREKRHISVTSTEVYDDIKKTAARNKLNVSQFYKAVRESNGLSSAQIQEKVKQKILSQKLYGDIAYSSITPPNESEVQEYYEMHKTEYQHPAEFTVVVYRSKDKARLQEKINNPMYYAPDIQTQEEVLPYSKIPPQLANLLSKTKLSSFTQIVPDGQNSFMSFYLKEVSDIEEASMESVKNQIMNTIMGSKRESVLSNHFARLRQNTEIITLRMPQE